MARARDLEGPMGFYLQDAEKKTVETFWGKFHDVLEVGGPKSNRKASNPLRSAEKSVFERRMIKIKDGRSHLEGGKAAWSFEDHGFCYIDRPKFDFEDHLVQNRKRVDGEFGPKVVEAVRAVTGAKQTFWMSHQRRAEKSVGKFAEMYATGGAHTDYGPEFEAQFRTVLHHRYGMDKEEADTCGLCLVNLWAPVQRPAYQYPLAVVDASTVDISTDTLRYKLHADFDNAYSYDNKGSDGKQKHSRPIQQRVPVAAQDAPALFTLYREKHRWVYLPDMTEEEAVVFKQYDFRRSAKTKATFHAAFRDSFHDGWRECPGRRSIECRLICTYDKDEPIPRL